MAKLPGGPSTLKALWAWRPSLASGPGPVGLGQGARGPAGGPLAAAKEVEGEEAVALEGEDKAVVA